MLEKVGATASETRGRRRGEHPIPHQREGGSAGSPPRSRPDSPTLKAGSTEALAPASMLSRSDEAPVLEPDQRQYAATAPPPRTHTAHAARDVPPHRASARYAVSRRGSTKRLMARLTRIRRSAAGRPARRRASGAAMCDLADIDSLAMVARSRADCLRRDVDLVARPVAFTGAAGGTSARLSHHRPKPADGRGKMSRPGAAKGVVPKNGIGMALQGRGTGKRRHREGHGAERDRGGTSRCGYRQP